jgi:hypothetical protein
MGDGSCSKELDKDRVGCRLKRNAMGVGTGEISQDMKVCARGSMKVGRQHADHGRNIRTGREGQPVQGAYQRLVFRDGRWIGRRIWYDHIDGETRAIR